MAAAAILDFVGSQIWWQKCFRDPIVNPCIKFGAYPCNSGRVIKISSKIQNGSCQPSWIIICFAGPPTKTTWWPEACVQISYQSNRYFSSYRHLKISQIWLKTPIHAPKIFVFRGFWLWPQTWTLIIETPKRHFLGRKHAFWHLTRRNQSSGSARTACEEYKKKGRTKVVTNWVFAPPTPLMRSLPYLALYLKNCKQFI